MSTKTRALTTTLTCILLLYAPVGLAATTSSQTTNQGDQQRELQAKKIQSGIPQRRTLGGTR